MSYEDKARERLDAKISEVPEAGCWIWTGAMDSNGYGQLSMYGGRIGAHRAAWMLHRGPIPAGLDLDHLCRTRSCVNPWHLEPVTHAENMRRSPVVGVRSGAMQRAKTHCPAGHPYDEANTHRRKRGSRECRACMRARSARQQRLKRAA